MLDDYEEYEANGHDSSYFEESETQYYVFSLLCDIQMDATQDFLARHMGVLELRDSGIKYKNKDMVEYAWPIENLYQMLALVKDSNIPVYFGRKV